MADIRINALATTAASTASDDFVAVDGSANGTRKLNAFSPTFGGNLTVSGSNATISNSAVSTEAYLNVTNNQASRFSYLQIANSGASGRVWQVGLGGSTAGSPYAGNLYLYEATGATTPWYITVGGNVTQTGNLTVSGTGTSSFAGPLNVTASSLGTFTSSTANATSGEQAFTIKGSNNSTSTNFGSSRAPSLVLWNNSGAANSYAALVFQDGGGNAVAGVQGLFIDDATNHGALTFWSRAASGSYAEAGRFTGSGNLLLKSDGVDSGNGRLQLADHTTSAGGIGFGADTSLFRSAAGALQLESSATAVLEIDGGAGNTRGIVIQAAGTEQAAITVAASGTSLLLSTGSPRTTALTLDSSQNATFAGNVIVNAGFAEITKTGTDLFLSTTASGRGITIRTGAYANALYLDSSQNATFSGNIKTAAPSGGTAATWRLGTVATVSPTSPNRTIEVEIGGTTYYIHAKTTNN